MTDYNSPSKGNQVICRMHPDTSRFSPRHLHNFMEDAAELGLIEISDPFKIVGKVKPTIREGTFLGYILSESHLVLIVNPDGTINYDLYTCRGTEDGTETLEYIRRNFDARIEDKVNMHVIPDAEHIKKDDFARSNGLFVPKHYLSSTFLGIDPSSLPKGRNEEERNADLTSKLRPLFGEPVSAIVSDYNEFYRAKSDVPAVTFLYVLPNGDYVWGHTYLKEFGSACIGTFRRDGRSTKEDLDALKKVFPSEKIAVMQTLEEKVLVETHSSR